MEHENIAESLRERYHSTLGYVHMGAATFGEASGRAYAGGFKQTTLLWHDKSTSRAAQYHEWATRAHCHTEAADVRLNCGLRQLSSCSGARWFRCLYLQNYTACPADTRDSILRRQGALSR